jgi:hypothetical protein
LLPSGSRVDSVCVFANDGTKYYVFLSELTSHVKRVSVLLADGKEAQKWHRLEERGMASQVEVRVAEAPPVVHYMLVPGRGAFFGPFLRRSGRASTSNSFVTFWSSPSGRSLTESLTEHFEREWDLAEGVRAE